MFFFIELSFFQLIRAVLDAAVVDVFYDGRDRFTKCMPINVGGRQGVPAGTLLPEVLEILTAQVIP